MRPGLPRSACRRSGRQVQGRRPALDHGRLVRALLIIAWTDALKGGSPVNAIAPGEVAGRALRRRAELAPPVCEAAEEETAAQKWAACPSGDATVTASRAPL